MRLAMALSLLRPALPLILGLSLGCSLSLLRVSWIQGDGDDPCVNRRGENELHLGRPDAGGPVPDTDEFKPRIVPYYRDPNKPYKKVLRTRYIQTELGFRERLFVAVLTSKNTLNTLAVAVNRTLAHHFHQLLFFSGMRAAKVPQGMQVVSHGDERPVWLMYETVRYILEHFMSQYDWFYVTQDDTYTQAERVKNLVKHLSINQDLYLGHAEEFIGGEEHARYCHGGYGYLISRSLLLKLQKELDSCRNDILSVRPDEWLGRCIIDFLGISCVNNHQGLRYYSFELGKNSDPVKEDSADFLKAFSVHPVSDVTLMYRLHKRFSEIELERTYEEINQLQLQIKNLTLLTPEGAAGMHWPIGINPPFVPKSRFEVINWEYFTEEHLFSCFDGSPKCELSGANKADVTDILETALEQLNQRYQPLLRFQRKQLLNGYRRFDPTRGMEYTLDLLLDTVTQKGHSHILAKRVSLLRPLSKVEIIPMPYVTEATRVQIILPLNIHDLDYVGNFLDMFAMNSLDTHDNALLTLLFIYDPYDAQRVNQVDVFAGVKFMVGELEKRYSDVKIPWISVKTEVPSQVKLMDIVSKKHPMDTLFFLTSVWTEINMEFLNRCRMNAISNWQVFFPIHFQEFNPVLMYRGKQPSSTSDFLRDGHFDRHVSVEACFYNSDYMAARTKMATDVLEHDEMLESLDVFDVFLRYSELHVFRALDPALVQKYTLRGCNPRLSEEVYHRCVLSNLEGLASRSNLAMALFEQEQANST
ncbi:chondroitin sulfate glucuronyltransferase [Rhinatrema bivittatum]|uniref:chondroitin sulfate glucuronyltransferase n=1 Tax=Rhinatrema bivittatum TaxID=194408 RepID=UPI0011294B7E|nr:chondroitin sulfate glucuronyltransferase [Rhinatrema bivittatum]XP_029443104.1 chondroitin sulfate glucuronyltransferase [Rhinatrema bivittatum]XP_029443105.1 chondroitin sulfate glucuronyltransferase [Rhinatrema bivittatum]XP_029443106.1 chondroitin sulfate glucuronyltransferase [Rhinatrema bivittatum]XP_029443107.1 chondroitin sulfate glucuronyltransferase [Rhinatrema bivittatum]XP_029443108.1 chondroitin sulfate glucuronyltransferase [Rhinatrema bivittatum]XP_029443109.1 chondroitin su